MTNHEHDSGKEWQPGTEAILDRYLGPYCGSVLATALRTFPEFSLLKKTSVHVDPDTDRIVGGVNDYGEPSVHIGKNSTAIPDGLKSRIIKRFELPPQLVEAPNGLFVPFIFGHELGHVLQADPEFPLRFGYCSPEVFQPEDGYAQYVESDHEVNADYIAALLVSNSQLGNEVGLEPPHEHPLMWREWGSQHRVT